MKGRGGIGGDCGRLIVVYWCPEAFHTYLSVWVFWAGSILL